MLFNFCHDRQGIAAIEIQETIVTLFCNPEESLIMETFFNYLANCYTKANILYTITHGEETKHFEKIHRDTSHLVYITHYHLIFEKPISIQHINVLLEAVEVYQDPINAKTRDEMEKRKKDLFSFSDSQSKDILQTKNIKLLRDSFEKMSRKKTRSFNSRDVYNYFNESIEQHLLPISSNLPKAVELRRTTCPQINAIAFAREPDYTTGNILAGVAGAVTAVIFCITATSILFWKSKSQNAVTNSKSTITPPSLKR
jgi:hypothetical protein